MQHEIIIDGEWARCGKCRNKLFKWTGNDRPAHIEIKCHSCKAINVTEKQNCGKCKYYHENACCKFESEKFSQTLEDGDSCDMWERREQRNDDRGKARRYY